MLTVGVDPSQRLIRHYPRHLKRALRSRLIYLAALVPSFDFEDHAGAGGWESKGSAAFIGSVAAGGPAVENVVFARFQFFAPAAAADVRFYCGKDLGVAVILADGKLVARDRQSALLVLHFYQKFSIVIDHGVGAKRSEGSQKP